MGSRRSASPCRPQPWHFPHFPQFPLPDSARRSLQAEGRRQTPGGIVVGGFRTFRYPACAGDGVAGTSSVSASEGVCAVSATPNRSLTSLREFPQFPQAICQSRGPARLRRCRDLVIPRNFRMRYVNGRWLSGSRGRVQCHRAMALREIIEASEHDADPVRVRLGRHTPQHCSGTSRDKMGTMAARSGAQDNLAYRHRSLEKPAACTACIRVLRAAA